ncbi:MULTISPECIES: non-ribosomal peptide synthetase [unclassified Caballeronia]|uniref:non-ribosomal peptide synthetase n=1 Tax=unclassified Caballeronia TaxID=2646786 RepID=UPI00285E6BBB|nr:MULTISPECIES: non-ribosomal peptide synthetase [unclassified Caballeronia]MDR5776827.1 amino acid adenylation domain-containing protein [Caballeronia sp. LZ002]MDR5798686.1 amino acid adenylation domain-containing protein [Caballeronia sp. LZ001]MDR5852267.1 amino acid adenylation domain-containing protein [Caballeronia sp. LZ003]
MTDTISRSPRADAASRRPDAMHLARQYASLAEDKRALFRARARAQQLDAGALPVVPLAPRPARFPLLPAQERLWFLWCLDPHHAGYHIAHTLRLTGRLDIAALQRALAQLVRRHEALRLRFEAQDGVPVQTVTGDAHYRFEQTRVADEGASLDDALRAFACAPFDLQHGPLLRVALFETSRDRHVLQFVVHHIVADAWSMDVLFRDLLTLYRAERDEGIERAACALPPLPVQLADYALWQREWGADERLAEQIVHWRERLDGAPAALTLPRDVPPRATRSHDGGLARVHLPPAFADVARRIARERRTTLFTVLLAVFDVLLYRYSGQRTVVVGVPTAGRARSELEQVVGFFVNTLIVRADLDGAHAFDAMLTRLHERVLDAQAHQDVPFAKLVEALGVERHLDSSPLFQVMFDLAVDAPDSAEPESVPGLRVESIGDKAVTARFDLALNARDRGAGRGIDLALTYAQDRFVASTAQRMLDDYAALLEQIAAQPARRIGDLAARGMPPRRADSLARSTTPAHVRVAQRARLCPARIALRCEGASLTYAELAGWGGRIALTLRADGIAPGERIGLMLERSLALPAALLGVLEAGGAFVPLDPEYPEARLRAMIDDARVTRIVVDETTRERWRDLLAPLRPISAPAARTATNLSARDDRAWTLWPDALAYVIYTSGSTGTPKGVAISHRSLALHLEDFLHDHRIAETDVVLQSSTINFDVALHELLPALIAGGRVVMRGPRAWELETLNRTLIDERVSFARIPTALWQQWRIALPPAAEIALRQITVGGEGLPGDALQRWFEGPLAHVAIDNLYGPTETTVAALHHPVTHGDTGHAIVAIGQCYPSRHAYVADADGNRAPDGAPGELCIGGATLAQGYLGRAALTAERFVPDPYGEPGSRTYRSGDLCRARTDGVIDFLGRIDQQVKLRGHRIELGEIEVALRRVDGVREAIADVRGEGDRKRLVAYFTGDAPPDRVRATLAGALPASHVPSVCMRLDALPTLHNGKLDRRALPDPDGLLETGSDAPDGARESALLAVWRTVLGRQDIGVTDNFFELGGDSISSLRVIAQTRGAGWTVTARQVFEHPTVRALARVARAADAQAASSVTLSGPVDAPLAPMQHWFFERFPAAPSRWNQAVLLRCADTLDVGALRTALAALLATHDALRARFRHDAIHDEWTQTIAPPSAARAMAEDALLVEEMRAAAGPADAAARIEAIAERVHGSLDLADGPLLRAACLATPEGSRLLVAVHHLVIDGVSWRILLDDLMTAYEAARTPGARVALPAPATTWAQWTTSLAHYARLPEHLGELAWWQAQLGHAAPFAKPLGDATLATDWTLDLSATRRLTESGARIDEVLLAALAHACAEHLPEMPAVVEMEGHGRTDRVADLDLSRTIGWFTTQFPLRLNALDDPHATRRAISTALQTVPAAGLHYNLFRFAGTPATRATLAALPPTTLGFNYLGRFEERLSEGRFAFAAEDSGNGTRDSVAAGPRHVLDLNGLIAGGCLKVDWSAAASTIDAQRLGRLIATFDTHVRAQVLDTHAVTEAKPRASGLALFDGLMRAAPVVTSDDDDTHRAFEVWRQRFITEAMLCPSIDACVQPLNASGAPLNLFCFYPGFGMVGEYRFLAAALQGVASVIALRSPAFAGDARVHADSFDALAEICVGQVLDVQSSGPFRLLGWSLGGRLAFAVAARLRARGFEVDFLGLLDTATHTGDMPEATSAADDALSAWLDAQADGARLRALFERTTSIDEMHYRLRVAHALPRIDVPLSFWRATRDTSAQRERDWQPWTSAAVHEIGIDATHSGIVHHPAAHAGVIERLRALIDG